LHSAGFRDVLTLIRFPVTLAVTFTAFAAMVMQSGEINNGYWWPLAGIFLLAAGASAFNQYQEWSYDEKMDRTRKRPIPSRRISPAEGVRIAMIGIAGGLIILMYESTWICLLLGVFNLIWYNGVYTWLKRKTAFAVVPGALTGAIPVYMGWTAMNGNLSDPLALFLAFFIFIWQMPHFWMMMLKYGDDYRKAGFPVLNDLFNQVLIRIIVMIWIVASSAVSGMFVHFRMVGLPSLSMAIIVVNIIMLAIVFWQFFLIKKMNFRLVFMAANLYVFLVLGLMMVDRLIFQS
jgi:protoheme IX farnesyltransferase